MGREQQDRIARALAVVQRHRGQGIDPAGSGEDARRMLDEHPELASLIAAFLDDGRGSGTGVAQDGAGSLSLAASAPGELLAGRYRVVGPLGRGGMGYVLLARDEERGLDVALKFLHASWSASADARARLRREARSGALEHPNLAQVHDFVDGVEPFLVMQHVAGEPLSGRIAARVGRPVSLRQRAPHADAEMVVREILELGIVLAGAVEHAHGHGIVHRDIKPSNVMIRPDGSPVLLDFGLAKHGEVSVELTRTGEVLGTPAYMAPEQVRGGPVDERSDVYALGVLLYECLAGRRPFDGVTNEALARQILAGDAPRLRGAAGWVGRDLDVVVHTAMQPDAAHRYGGAGALAEDLRRVRDGRPILARRPSIAARAVRWCRREPVLAGLLGLLGLASGVAGWAAWSASTQRDLADEAARQAARQESLAEAAAREAQDERDFARQATAQAQAEQARAEEAAQEARLLAAQARVEEARDAVDEMVPAWPGQVGALRWWIDGLLAPLVAMEPELRAELERVREARSAGLADDGLRFLERSHSRALAGIAELRDAHAPRVREALDWAGSVAGRSLEEPADRWVTAIEAVAASDGVSASTLYDGLHLTPQMGLVPLRMNPASKLWEFVHLRSGAPGRECPRLDPETDRWVVTPDTGMVFVLIPGGVATIGAQNVFPDREHYDEQTVPAWEMPVHTVELGPFFLSKYELTQAQWARLGEGDWPAFNALGDETALDRVIDARNPVENISWHQAVERVHRHGLVLPSECQWEYACRAGTGTRFFTGDALESLAGHVNLLDLSVGRFRPHLAYEATLEDGFAAPAPVDALLPNALGLHSMAGNVAEWCADPQLDYSQAPRPGDGLRQGDGPSLVNRAVRGGSYYWPARGSRSAERNAARPTMADAAIGLRPARLVLP